MSDPSLGEVLRKILTAYPSPDQTRGAPTSDFPDLQQLVTRDAKQAVKSALGDLADEYNIAPTMGQGSASDIPYIPIERPDETQSTQMGIYVVYLFDPLADVLYLTLNQGSTEAQRTSSRDNITPSSTTILKRHAEEYRQRVTTPSEFDPEAAKLSEDLKRSKNYNQGAIFTKAYDPSDLTDDSQVIDDLKSILSTYDDLIHNLYSTPELDIGSKQVWTISPDGGTIWDDWVANNVASIGWKNEADEIAGLTEETAAKRFGSKPESAPERQVYEFVHSIDVGDIVIAGASKNKIDVVFGIGCVTQDYGDFVDSGENPEIHADAGPHHNFIGVDWVTFGSVTEDGGVAVNCLKQGKRLFQQWTLHPFKAQVDHLIGATCRRMQVAELITDLNEEIDLVSETLGVMRIDSDGADEDSTGPSDPMDTYNDWNSNRTDAFEDAPATIEDPDLVFPSNQKARILNRVQSALESDKHVILTGPPGTGKTKLARHIARQYVEDRYRMVTASADWSTFDTIGGYRPETDRTLEFHPGVFLERFMTDDDGTPKCEWVVIDELNRADIDKAFGPLFSALTGETVTLPFDAVNNKSIQLIGDPKESSIANLSPNHYFIPNDWRLIGTMNTYDKTSLYQMSYAFMRRFAFVPVEIPEEITVELVQEYVSLWNDGSELDRETASVVKRLWKTINSVRPIGPAIIRDMLSVVNRDQSPSFTDSIIMYVMPQLEGLTKAKQRDFVSKLEALNEDEDEEYIQTSEIKRFAREYFDVGFEE